MGWLNKKTSESERVVVIGVFIVVAVVTGQVMATVVIAVTIDGSRPSSH